MKLNTILQKLGDFLGRKFKKIKDYVDGQITAITEAWKAGDTNTYNDMKTYVDGQSTSIKTYVDTQDTTILQQAKNYTDAAGSEIKTFVLEKHAEALANDETTYNNAVTYTNGKYDDCLAKAKAYTDSEVTNLINGAPETLDTLKEIADAIQEIKDKDDSGDVLNQLTQIVNNHIAAIGTWEELVTAFNNVVGTDSIFYEDTTTTTTEA